MSSPPPTKPPRGVKQGRETSGLLMSVIRTLSASETNEQREKERAKLEKEYKKSDARLDELVAEHASEIMEVMQKFSTVGAALSAWGSRCDAAGARLAACRQLLRLRHDDLRRLWAHARTTHLALNMLTDIEQVVVSERQARSHIQSGRVLAAAGTLRAALTAADTSLAHVSATRTTRDHLEVKKRELVDLIVKNLSNAVYRGEPQALTRRPFARRRTALLLAELTKSEEVTDAYLQDITPEFEASLSEEDKTFETTVMISLEALGVLEQLKEATEKFKVQIQSELLEVIDTISRRIVDSGDLDLDAELEQDGDIPAVEGATETGRPLARLLACLGDEFRASAQRNRRLLQLWRAALQRHQITDSCLHTEQHYWSAVQQVLQLLLTEYLDIESVTLAGARASAIVPESGQELRLADYFAKKRAPRRRTRLFTLQPLVPTTTTQTRRVHRYPLVCRPDPAHLHAVLPALHALAKDIEPHTGGGECSLRAFITNYVREGEAERLASAARVSIEQCMREAGAWRERGPPTSGIAGREQHHLIFTCCNTAWEAVTAAARAARRCGACGGSEAARASVAALATLAAHCRAAHARMAPSPPHPSRAARWLADDDIVRFLQSLPNWKAAISTEPISEDRSHEQELKQAYEREAEILGSSLGDGAVARREIIGETAALADLALLCESMAWISTNIKSLPTLLSGVKLSDKLHNDIASAAMIFDEIQHKCVLLLHLEMRIQCFYYLGQEETSDSGSGAGGAGGGEEEGAGGAARLAHALLAFHEQVSNVLAPRRLAYIMCGVGEMMSAGVVMAGGACGAGAEETAAVHRLATLRHCLAALQLPHAGLAAAHRYIQLLAASPEEIIQSIREKGAQFSELEYLNAFKIIGTKRGLSQSDMKAFLKQLSSALGHIGVTV